MEDKFNLSRFLDAQSKTYEKALSEIKNGKKITHWMWFIFPQIQGLGYSSKSQKYSIKSREEALQYYNHDVLGSRLIEITNAFLNFENKTAFEVFGEPDYIKMNSCMTLFNLIQTESDIFSKVLHKYYLNSMCQLTISKIDS